MLGCCLSLFQVHATAFAQNEVPDHKLKAVFIQNILQYVIWPEGHFPKTPPEIQLCTIGNDRVGAALKELGSSAKHSYSTNVSIDIQIPDKKQLHTCDVIYISQQQHQNLPFILQQLGDRPILTISDIHDFTKAGGMVGFTQEDNRVQIELNISALDQAHMEIATALRQLVRVIR